MTFRKLMFFACIAVFGLFLGACNLPIVDQTPTLSIADQMYTDAAKTVEVRLTQAALATTPSTPQAVVTAQATNTPMPTLTQSQPTVQNVTISPTPICDRADFVGDVTIDDGTIMDSGETFTKTWRLSNSGTCTWTTDYALVFDHGNAMNGPSFVNLPRSVAPGESIDLSVSLTAPSTSGEQIGYWKLRNASGVTFGIGDDGDEPFYVEIVVSDVLAVTSVVFNVNPVYSGVCSPANLAFSAAITFGGSGTVQYHWLFSDAENSAVQTLNFSSAGTQTVTYTLQLTKSAGSYTGWAKIYIDEPNHQEFGQATYTLTCTP